MSFVAMPKQILNPGEKSRFAETDSDVFYLRDVHRLVATEKRLQRLGRPPPIPPLAHFSLVTPLTPPYRTDAACHPSQFSVVRLYLARRSSRGF